MPEEPEGGPIGGGGSTGTQRVAGVTGGLGGGLAGGQRAVEGQGEVSGGGVFHGPEGGQEVARTALQEDACQAEQSLAVHRAALGGFAGAQHDQ
jgi:hypothetical protein